MTGQVSAPRHLLNLFDSWRAQPASNFLKPDVAVLGDLLSQFDSWGRQKGANLLKPYVSQDPALPDTLKGDVSQGVIFRDDFKRSIHNLFTQSQYEVLSLVHTLAIPILSPFAILGEIYRLCIGLINVSTCLKNIFIVPKRIISSIFRAAFYVARSMNKAINAASIGIGFMIWHGAEHVIRLITSSPHTVLSNSPGVRNIVYHALGITLLAAVMMFIPAAPIQMMALPIICGSIYGTINNQFTLRECPEYYTMGHVYDGTDLKRHAIKTNNLLIKPIITGCYATTLVTKLAGIILAAVGTIPYTAAILPASLAGAMIAGVSAISLIVAHLFSTMKKNSIQKNLDALSKLLDFEWDETNLAKTWYELTETLAEVVEQKRKKLAANPQKLDSFNKELKKLANELQSNILSSDLPIKYIAGWQANNTRNSIGYLFAGGGTLAIAVTTIFLRIFAL